MEHTTVIRAVLNVYKECRIRSFPIDCVDILNHYGYTIYTYEELKHKSRELYQMCMGYSDDAFCDRHSMTVAYNPKKPWGRIRFSLMHELGHHILKHKTTSPDNERDANVFSSNILVPRIAIHYSGCHTKESVSKLFGVTCEAAGYALSDHKKWYRHTSGFLSETDKEMYRHFYDPNDDCFVWNVRVCEFCGAELHNTFENHCDFCELPKTDLSRSRRMQPYRDFPDDQRMLKKMEHLWLYGKQ